jgi:hypothetical protein
MLRGFEASTNWWSDRYVRSPRSVAEYDRFGYIQVWMSTEVVSEHAEELGLSIGSFPPGVRSRRVADKEDSCDLRMHELLMRPAYRVVVASLDTVCLTYKLDARAPRPWGIRMTEDYALGYWMEYFSERAERSVSLGLSGLRVDGGAVPDRRFPRQLSMLLSEKVTGTECLPDRPYEPLLRVELDGMSAYYCLETGRLRRDVGDYSVTLPCGTVVQQAGVSAEDAAQSAYYMQPRIMRTGDRHA